MPIFLERVILPILVALLLILAVTNPFRLPVWVQVLGSISVLFIAWLISRWLHFAASKKQVAAPMLATKPMPKAVQERIFVTKTVQEMIDSVGGLTDAEADKLGAAYVGKWTEVSGEVANVHDDPFTHEVVVRLRPPPNHSLIIANLYFIQNLESVRLLRIGARITAVGQIYKVRCYGYDLERCELTSMG